MARLRDDGATDFERFLLDSADEAPAPDLRARVLAGLGAAGALGGVASMAHAASIGAQGASSAGTAAGTGTAAGASAGTAAGVTAAAQATATTAVKALLVKAVLTVTTIGATTGVVAVAIRNEVPEVRAPSVPLLVTAAPAVVPLPRVQRPHEPPAVTLDDLAVDPPVAPRPAVPTPRAGVLATPAPAPSASTSPPEPPKASTVASEVAVLDRARTALSAGNAGAALAELAEYDAQFPGGALRQEKTLLEVRALLAAGQKQKARERVEAFLAEHPGSPQATRLRSLVE